MTAYRTKTPDEEREFALDWDELETGETLDADLGWMIVPDELDPQALAVVSVSREGARSAAVVRGGRPGHLYHLSNRVRTSLGRVLSRAVLVRVVAA